MVLIKGYNINIEDYFIDNLHHVLYTFQDVTMCDFLNKLTEDNSFIRLFNRLILCPGFNSVNLEIPVINRRNWKTKKLTIAVIETNLSSHSDPHKFQNIINKCFGTNLVVSGHALQRDGRLIIPCNTSGKYGHLVEFLKRATKKEIDELWSKTAFFSKRSVLNKESVWISTHGHSVPWLHVRVMDNPKYYHNQYID